MTIRQEVLLCVNGPLRGRSDSDADGRFLKAAGVFRFSRDRPPTETKGLFVNGAGRFPRGRRPGQRRCCSFCWELDFTRPFLTRKPLAHAGKGEEEEEMVPPSLRNVYLSTHRLKVFKFRRLVLCNFLRPFLRAT